MKQLFLNDTATTFFFESEINIDDICLWINASLVYGVSNLFNLNETYGAIASVINESEIIINSDDDAKDIEIREVKLVNLNVFY